MREGRSGGYDVVILDTAGRLTIDDVLMDEVVAVRDLVQAARNAAGRRCHDRAGRRDHGDGL